VHREQNVQFGAASTVAKPSGSAEQIGGIACSDEGKPPR
jgi:hypothetical protein